MSSNASIATLGIMVIAVLACIPIAKAPCAGLTYYVNIENPSPPNFYRSATPWNFVTSNYNYSQWVTPSGGIVTTLTPLPGGTGGYADLGIGFTFGRLGDITSIPISGSGTYAINIYIDMNTTNDIGGNGPFFSWSGDSFDGLDGDEYGLGPQITNSGAITTADAFQLVAHGYNTYTIAQLQSGIVAGIDSNTVVGFWLGITSQMNPRFEIYLINGQPPCVPPAVVGGESVSLDTTQVQVRLVGYAAAMSAVAASFVGLRRLKKKQD